MSKHTQESEKQGELEILENHLIDEALRESEKRFRDIVITMAGWIWEVDLECKYTYCSEKVEKILGYTVDEMMSKLMTWTMLPNEADNVQRLMGYFSEEKWPIEEWEVWHQKKNGESVCLLVNGVPIISENDELEGYRGVAKDITEKKQAEEERERLIVELEEALSKIKTLKGLIPICASCKKIRDDKGFWNKLEAYIETHSEAEFSHGICPDCLDKLYPDFVKSNEERSKVKENALDSPAANQIDK